MYVGRKIKQLIDLTMVDTDLCILTLTYRLLFGGGFWRMKSCNSRIVVRQPFRLFQALRINQSYILATNILLYVWWPVCSLQYFRLQKMTLQRIATLMFNFWCLIEAWSSYSMEDRRPKKEGDTLKEKLRKGALNVFRTWKKKAKPSGNNYCCCIISFIPSKHTSA